MKDIYFEILLADKAYDANWNIVELKLRRTKIMVSSSARRKVPLSIDLEVYKWRYLSKNLLLQT